MAKTRAQLQEILDELRASVPRWQAEAAAEDAETGEQSSDEERAQHLLAAFAGVADEAWENVSAEDEAWLGERMDALQKEFGIGL